jgi:signal transduction histidine kinase
LFLILFFALGITAEQYVLKGGIRQQDIKRFSSTLEHKQAKLDKIIEKTSKKLSNYTPNEETSIFELLKESNELFEHKELTILVTKNDEPVYWSDHVVGFVKEIVSATEGFVQLPNGWFVLTRQKCGDYFIHGLVLIKYNYKIENVYLQNKFARGLHLPDDFEVLFYTSETSYPIYNRYNQFLFAIQPSGALPCIYSDLYLPVGLYLMALLFLLILLYRINSHYFHRFSELKLLVLLALLIGFYALMNRFHLPRSMYMLELFSPKHFAYSSFWSSLGEFLFFSVLLFFWGINFSRTFDLWPNLKGNPLKRRLSLFIWLLQLGVFFIVIRFLLVILISNSSISYAVFRIEEISFHSFLGFLSLGFLFLSFFFVAFRTIQIFRKHSSQKEFLISLAVVYLLLLIATLLIDRSEHFRTSIFFPILLVVGFYVNKRGILKHRLTVVVLFVLIFTLFTLFSLVKYVELRENKVQETMAINLSEEHDPTAELYLLDIDYKLKNDNSLQSLLVPPYNDFNTYLSRKYFGGYMHEYDLQLTLCQANDSLIIQPHNTSVTCIPFFNQMIEKYGAAIPETNFYFLDNMNGRITYLGVFHLKTANESPIELFIELNSKLLSEGTGFPELLLPQHSFENKIRNNFSFAKYNQGELVDRGGEYLYTLSPKSFNLNQGELSFQVIDNFVHCVYCPNKGSYIIVSRPKVKAYHYLITFPYVFVFFFILFLLVNFITRPYLHFPGIKSSLRMRIQVSIIGIVFTTLFIVGSGTIAYIIAQYQNNHRQDLIDKVNSVSAEIDLIMGNINELDPELVSYLNFELSHISEVFWTDVNIYDLSGKLLISSRPEVFEKGLISEQMDNTAFYLLNKNQPTRFLHREHIAEMEYLSAYVPLFNKTGKNIGYINLPYFTKERVFRQEITTFILAFINIYVFLLLASILVAYFISNRITDPLKLIRENLRNMQLGKRSKPIAYQGEDEIGILVSEYNNKVAELAHSAELLARSERETAWREMAKQIAHEIKNPLTPMKLNIQFLQRSAPEKLDDYTEKVMRVTETLIEQIDNLSAIATEFSNFAKMPKAQNEKFELGTRLKEILKLYNYTGQVEINTNLEGLPPMFVYADKEQFSRAIINLVRNAIQSVPESVQGKIKIELLKKNKQAIIKISDNGKGIPADLRDRIFVPNFTTKSSGAGLGLAITKNIVENFNGEISFTSIENEGTTFMISMPLKNN